MLRKEHIHATIRFNTTKIDNFLKLLLKCMDVMKMGQLKDDWSSQELPSYGIDVVGNSDGMTVSPKESENESSVGNYRIVYKFHLVTSGGIKLWESARTNVVSHE